MYLSSKGSRHCEALGAHYCVSPREDTNKAAETLCEPYELTRLVRADLRVHSLATRRGLGSDEGFAPLNNDYSAHVNMVMLR